MLALEDFVILGEVETGGEEGEEGDVVDVAGFSSKSTDIPKVWLRDSNHSCRKVMMKSTFTCLPSFVAFRDAWENFRFISLENRLLAIDKTVASKSRKLLSIRDFAFQWDSDIKDLCSQNKQAKSGILRETLSLVLEKMCVHECL